MNAAALAFAGLLAVRASLPAHAPSLVDGALALAFAAVLLLVLRARRAPAGVAAAALLVVVGAALSIPTSFDPYVSALALPLVLGPAAALVTGAALPSSLRATALVGLAAGGAVNAVVAAHQRFIVWPDAAARAVELGLGPEQIERLTSGRPIGASLSPDLMGALCIAGAVAALALAWSTTSGPLRAAALGVASVAAAGAVLSRSFGVGLATAIGAGVVVVARARDRRVAAAGAGLAALTGVLALAARGASAASSSAGERLENWRAAIAIFLEHPALGVGLARFAPAYLPHRSAAANTTRYAHSFFLQRLDETGAVGALLLVIAAVLVVVAAWRATAARRSDPTQALLAGGAAALVARWAWDYDGDVAQTATIACALVGLACAGDDGEAAPAARGASATRGAVVAALVALLPITLLLSWREAALDPYARGADAPTDDDDARLEAYADRFTGDLEAQVRAGERRAARGDVDAARATWERAADGGHAPPHVYEALAAMAERRGDVEEAARRRAQARARDPHR